jgi:hypothetical protein
MGWDNLRPLDARRKEKNIAESHFKGPVLRLRLVMFFPLTEAEGKEEEVERRGRSRGGEYRRKETMIKRHRIYGEQRLSGYST